MIISVDLVTTASTTTMAYIQVPCDCSLLAVKAASGVDLADINTLTISDGTHTLVNGEDLTGVAGTVVEGTIITAGGINKTTKFTTALPIKAEIVTAAGDGGPLDLIFELDEFVRSTD